MEDARDNIPQSSPVEMTSKVTVPKLRNSRHTNISDGLHCGLPFTLLLTADLLVAGVKTAAGVYLAAMHGQHVTGSLVWK